MAFSIPLMYFFTSPLLCSPFHPNPRRASMRLLMQVMRLL